MRRRLGTAPDRGDPILCSVNGTLSWKPWANCTPQFPVAVTPTRTPAVPGIAVAPTKAAVAPTVVPPPVAGNPTPFTAPPCSLTLISPYHGSEFGTEAKPLSLVWHYDRVLPDNHYFFAEIQYIKQDYEGQAWLGTRY